ncbi:hypothetical protein BpHYR1_045382 [Brachionus plicatilis]|uniref:Uncharacterized protein n=1 Tax=Brachionus plicatilis TaxID=10195 RepID=A0A3M7PUR1_BRAPC|nr:hypothetical protein BpHYR1_045382 [Brachionus plicatilis]
MYIRTDIQIKFNKLKFNFIWILKVGQIFTSQEKSSNIFWITEVPSILSGKSKRKYKNTNYNFLYYIKEGNCRLNIEYYVRMVWKNGQTNCQTNGQANGQSSGQLMARSRSNHWLEEDLSDEDEYQTILSRNLEQIYKFLFLTCTKITIQKKYFQKILHKFLQKNSKLCKKSLSLFVLNLLNPIGKITKNYIKFDSILTFICEHTNLTESTKPRFLSKNI